MEHSTRFNVILISNRNYSRYEEVLKTETLRSIGTSAIDEEKGGGLLKRSDEGEGNGR